MLLAVVLTIVVIVIANLLFPPPTPQPAAPEAAEEPVDAPVPPAEPADPAVPPVAEVEEPVARPPVEEPELLPEETVTVSSALYRYGFSSRGGGLVAAELVRYESFANEGQVVDLVPEEALALLTHRVQLRDRDRRQELVLDFRRVQAAFEPEDGFRLGDIGEPDLLRTVLRDRETGITLHLEHRFDPDDYLIRVSGRLEGVDSQVYDRPILLLDVGPSLAVHEVDPREDRREMAYVINSLHRGIESEDLESVDSHRVAEGPLSWLALKNKYFLLAAVRGEGAEANDFGGIMARPAQYGDGTDITATLPFGQDWRFEYLLYAGPQQHDRLAAVGYNLEHVNPYGFRFLRPIIQPLTNVVTWALVQMKLFLGVGYGWVLILFGILLRVLLWPIHARAMRAQIKNMAVQPLLKEIQEKYKGDQERLQKEMIRLYKEEGFNPLGGCLPMLIPFPILITLFFVFQGTIEFRGVEFMWLSDLSRPDPYYILPVALGGSMFLLQWLSARVTPNPTPQIKMMMWFLPIFMVVIFANFASGLNLYYAAFNLATIPQQLQLMRERQRLQKKTAPQEAAA